MRISAVMPAYNEAANIEETVRYCFQVLNNIEGDAEVVVTNDGSKDETGAILDKLKGEFPGLVVLTNSPNQGYGAALTKAIESSSGELIITMDSDGQFDIADAIEAIETLPESIDVQAGYRKAKKDSLFKVLADRIMNRMIRVMFGVSFRDTNCALKVIRKESLDKFKLEARGFQLPTEIVLKANVLNLNVTEFPVNHRERPGGQSSLAPFKTGWNMFIFLWYLRRKFRLYKKGVLRSI